MDPSAIIDMFRRNVTEHYFDLSGRVSRTEFWYFVLACFVLYIGAAIIDVILPLRILTVLLSLALLLPMTGMGARRLQDTGKNGALVWIWTIIVLIMQVIGLLMAITGPIGAVGFLLFFFSIGWLISLASLVISVLLIYFWVQPGTSGPNAFGPDPLAKSP